MTLLMVSPQALYHVKVKALCQSREVGRGRSLWQGIPLLLGLASSLISPQSCIRLWMGFRKHMQRIPKRYVRHPCDGHLANILF